MKKRDVIDIAKKGWKSAFHAEDWFMRKARSYLLFRK